MYSFSLELCISGYLSYFHRLASVQEHRPAQVVALAAQARIPTKADRQTVMANIQAMVPNHDARVQSIMVCMWLAGIAKRSADYLKS